MATIEPTHNLESAAAFLDGPLGLLSPLTAVWDRARLQGLQVGIRKLTLPWWTFKGKIEKLVHVWATIAGTLDAMALRYPGLRTDRGGHPFADYAEAARDHAGSLIAEAERRRAGDSGGLWGIWAASRDSGRQLAMATGLGDPFDPNADPGLFLRLLPYWPVAAVAVGAAWLLGPRLLEGAVAGWRRGGAPRGNESGFPRDDAPRGFIQ